MSLPQPGERGWVDSHCHLPLLAQGGEDPAAVVDRARAAGVTGMVCVGTHLESSAAAVADAGRFPGVAATVGLHPHDADRLDAEWDGLVALVESDVVVGIGETGFDLYYTNSPPAEQERSFRLHVQLARRLGRALVVHSRDAWDDTFRVLEDEGVPQPTVLHCFTGGPDVARRALAAGMFLSFSGIVSFTNADDVRAAAAVTPLDRMLVETDAPFLAPVPHRGKTNEPAFVVDVGRALASAASVPVEEVAEATRSNALNVFGLSL